MYRSCNFKDILTFFVAIKEGSIFTPKNGKYYQNEQLYSYQLFFLVTDIRVIVYCKIVSST